MENIAEEPVQSKGSSKVKIVIPALLVVALGLGGWSYHRAHQRAAAPEETPRVVAILHLENFTVNLADQDQSSFLRAGIDLGLTKALPQPGKDKDAIDPVPVVRDSILTVLSSATSDEILTPDGKNKLKDQIIKSLRERTSTLGVQEIYFTEFLVQR